MTRPTVGRAVARFAPQREIDRQHMARCLELAEKFRGRTSPNPIVGCVIVNRAGKVIVGPREALKTHTVRLRDVNWLGAMPLAEAAAGNGAPVEVKVRSTRGPQPAVIQLRGGDVYVTLVSGEYGVSPGQACVFYTDDSATSEVLGGGFIAEAVPQALVA